MHTLGSDAQNMLELLRGYLAAEALSTTATVACPLVTLEIADLFSLKTQHDTAITLRNLVVILEDVGHSSPYHADLFAGHFGVALALYHAKKSVNHDIPTFSVNGSHPQATHSVTANFTAHTASVTTVTNPALDTPLPVPFGLFEASLWLCHSAALLGTMTRIRDAIAQPLNHAALTLSEESTRALVQATAERFDHALGQGPHHDSMSFGARYDNTAFTTVMRRSVFAHLDLLITHSQPPLSDALAVVSGRASHGFGEPEAVTFSVSTATVGD